MNCIFSCYAIECEWNEPKRILGCIFQVLDPSACASGQSIHSLKEPTPKGLTDKGKRQKINEILEAEEGIAMASEVLLNISKDEIKRARLMSELKYELDTQSRLTEAKREGLMEGEKIGIKEGIKEGIKKGETIGEQKIIDLLKSGKSPEDIIQEYEGK